MKKLHLFTFLYSFLFVMTFGLTNSFAEWSTPITLRTETDLDYHAHRSVAFDGSYLYVLSSRATASAGQFDRFSLDGNPIGDAITTTVEGDAHALVEYSGDIYLIKPNNDHDELDVLVFNGAGFTLVNSLGAGAYEFSGNVDATMYGDEIHIACVKIKDSNGSSYAYYVEYDIGSDSFSNGKCWVDFFKPGYDYVKVAHKGSHVLLGMQRGSSILHYFGPGTWWSSIGGHQGQMAISDFDIWTNGTLAKEGYSQGGSHMTIGNFFPSAGAYSINLSSTNSDFNFYQSGTGYDVCYDDGTNFYIAEGDLLESGVDVVETTVLDHGSYTYVVYTVKTGTDDYVMKYLTNDPSDAIPVNVTLTFNDADKMVIDWSDNNQSGFDFFEVDADKFVASWDDFFQDPDIMVSNYTATTATAYLTKVEVRAYGQSSYSAWSPWVYEISSVGNISEGWSSNHPKITWSYTYGAENAAFDYYEIQKLKNGWTALTTLSNEAANSYTDGSETKYSGPGSGSKIWIKYRIRAVDVLGNASKWSNSANFAVSDPGGPGPMFKTGKDLNTIDLIPSILTLSQNYPNPFNPTTRISFGLPEASSVQLSVYNVTGQRIAVLAEQYLEAGFHSFAFEATHMPSGVYYYTLKASGMQLTKKMLLTK